jgi:hypothetical protein
MAAIPAQRVNRNVPSAALKIYVNIKQKNLIQQ